MKPTFHKKFQKFVKKTRNKELFNRIKEEVDSIIKNPVKGKHLEHPFRKYKIQTTTFIYKSNSYRIAYTINPKEKEIVFLVIDSRENFYEKLSRIV